MKINMVSRNPDSKCGIASHTKFLFDELKKICDVELITIDHNTSINPLYFLELGRKARKKCDIVHVQYDDSFFGLLKLGKISLYGIYAPIFYLALKLFKGPKVITTIHEILDAHKESHSGVKRALKRAYYGILRFFVYKCSDKTIVHTDNGKELLLKKGIEQDRIVVISLGSHQTPIFMDKKISKDALYLSNRKVLTTFGYIHAGKGYDLLIDVLPNLSEDTVLLVAGEPRLEEHEQYFEMLKNKVKELRLENRVVFYGFVEDKDIPMIFNASDIFVLPYTSITNSAVLAMALAYNKPIIASDIESFKEIKSKYDCIELFHNEDMRDLLDKINYLLNDAKKQEYLRLKAKEYWKDTNFRDVAKMTKGLYTSLMRE